MSSYQLTHHQIIEAALKNFNAHFLEKHDIIFGGGTRIALELDEYRESIDIDFLCPNKNAYRSVRENVTNTSLGKLVKEDFTYIREVRADRDAVRTIIQYQSINIKLEFISFEDYDLKATIDYQKFPIPFLDQTSCFYTKLLANADRKNTAPYKDIFDILAMYKSWGVIPKPAIKYAESHYGKSIVIPSLIQTLQNIVDAPDKYLEAAQQVCMKPEWAKEIIYLLPQKLLEDLGK